VIEAEERAKARVSARGKIVIDLAELNRSGT
jgi:hypothetical protein